MSLQCVNTDVAGAIYSKPSMLPASSPHCSIVVLLVSLSCPALRVHYTFVLGIVVFVHVARGILAIHRLAFQAAVVFPLSCTASAIPLRTRSSCHESGFIYFSTWVTVGECALLIIFRQSHGATAARILIFVQAQ